MGRSGRTFSPPAIEVDMEASNIWRMATVTQSRLTDTVEKGFSRGRTDFFRGTGAAVRK